MFNERFQSLDRYLTDLKRFWQFEAFHHGDYPWQATDPALCEFLDNITEQELLTYQQHPNTLLPHLSAFIGNLLALTDELFCVPLLAPKEIKTPFWLSNGIKGRKWSQISAFANQVNNQNEIVEWCAGKGHLGRLISWQQELPVTSIEWQQSLCEAGEAESKKMQLNQHFKQADVLKGEADYYIKPDVHAIALHACGDLHLRLITLAKTQQPAQLTISPCCYHLTQKTTYQPYSRVAKTSLLNISKQQLKLAVNKQTTTGKRQSRLSEQEVLWRLAFDELQKQMLKTEHYFPLPSFPKALLSGQFSEFVNWAMLEKSLQFQLPACLQPFLELAQKRVKKVRRMELLSQFFVRPLELWLVYDRALALQESGYQVRLSTFCAEKITPRNLLIQARLTEQ